MSKRIKYLGINSTKEEEDSYSKKYKTLMKKSENDTKRWKDVPCSLIKGFNIVKMFILSKVIYKLNAITIKISTIFFTELKKNL